MVSYCVRIFEDVSVNYKRVYHCRNFSDLVFSVVNLLFYVAIPKMERNSIMGEMAVVILVRGFSNTLEHILPVENYHNDDV